MNIGAVNRTLGLAKAILNYSDAHIAADFGSRKPRFSISPAAEPLERSTPESEGVSGERIADFLDELYEDLSLNMHNVMILRHGKIIAATSFGKQNINSMKMTFSACKSIVSLAIGMLCDEGRLSLDDKICGYFQEELGAISRLKLRELTVEHLLTMSSGVVFNEAEAVTEDNWLRAFFSSATKFAPGKEFSYNSLNTYVLSALVTKLTGTSLTEYLTPRLFEPLRINDIYWAKCPRGIDIGGWGLYIRPEDIAKIGILVMNGGVWHGERIISESYIHEATRAHMEVPISAGEFNYGYQIWVGRDGNSFLFNGMLGQNLLAFPASEIILVTNASNDEMFQQDDYFKIALKYFDKPFPSVCLKRSRDAKKRLTRAEKRLKIPRGARSLKPLPPPLCIAERFLDAARDERVWKNLAGRRFSVRNKPAHMRLVPIALQVIEGAYTSNLVEIEFCERDGRRQMIYREEENTFTLPLGEISEIEAGGNIYAVALSFSHFEDASGILTAKITVDFLETPFTRIITVAPNGENSVIAQGEIPTETLLKNGADGILRSLNGKPIVSGFAEKFDEDYIDYRIVRLFSPRIFVREEASVSRKSASITRINEENR